MRCWADVLINNSLAARSAVFSLRGGIIALVLFVDLCWVIARAEVLPWEYHFFVFCGNAGFWGVCKFQERRETLLRVRGCMEVPHLCPELADRVGSARKCILFLCTVSGGLEVHLEGLSERWPWGCVESSQQYSESDPLGDAVWSRPRAWVSLMPCLVSFQLFQFKKDNMVSSLICLNVTQWNGLGGKGL